MAESPDEVLHPPTESMNNSEDDGKQEKFKEQEGSLEDGTVRIHVWASPRTLSTVLMYSFAQVKHDENVHVSTVLC